jgi:hypothetical protein
MMIIIVITSTKKKLYVFSDTKLYEDILRLTNDTEQKKGMVSIYKLTVV